MVKFYISIEQLMKIYRYLLNHEKIKNSIINTSLWLGGFSMTIKNWKGDTRFFDFTRHPTRGYFYIKGDYPEIEEIILDYIHEKGSIGEEDWSISYE